MARRRRRAPKQVALSDRDREYLSDFVQFGFMGHAVAAEAFRLEYEHADEAAALVRGRLERVDPGEGAVIARELNDGARVQSIVVARLASEYAAAIEDLAAMVVAIAGREAGVMRAYLASEVSETGDVLAAIDRGDDLQVVLRLPDPASLPDSVDDEVRAGVEHAFGAFAESMRQIASAARNAGERTESGDGGGAAAPDRIAIVLAVGDPTRTPPRGLLFQAHNKIKHRFMLVERIESLGDIPSEVIRYATAPRNPAFVMAQVSNITQVCLASAELAALLLALDGAEGASINQARRSQPAPDSASQG